MKRPNGELTNIKNEIIKVVEDFYMDLYTSNELPRPEVDVIIRDVPNIRAEEIKRALKGMEMGKTPEDVHINKEIIDAGKIRAVKLANLFNRSLTYGKTPQA